MSEAFVPASPASAQDERKREEPPRDAERTFARHIDCTPDAPVRAPQRTRSGRGVGIRESERVGSGEARRAARR